MQKILHTPKLLPPLSTRAHGYEYYSKTSKSGMVYCRKLIGHMQEVSLRIPYTRRTAFLPINTWPKLQEVLLDSKYLRMTNLSIRKVLLSPNHGIFAYQTEREGEEVGNLHFKDLSGITDLKVFIYNTMLLLYFM